MIKNVALKKLIQNTIFAVLSAINKRKRHNGRKILLYSNMGFRDNIKALAEYLTEERYGEEYEIVISTSDSEKYKDLRAENVRFVGNVRGIWEFFDAGYVYYAFGKIPIVPGKGQKVVQMWHASPFKAADRGMKEAHSGKRQYYTTVYAASEVFVPFFSDAFSFPKEKIVLCGRPLNDVLYKGLHYDMGTYEKLILWAPTFRQSDILGYSDTHDAQIIPIFKMSELAEVNEYLKKKHVKVVVKLHPMQSLAQYEMLDMEALVLMSHKDMTEKGIELYGLLAQADALITDYSSIHFDYLLLNRPCAFTEDDAEDYGRTRGWALEHPEDFKPGHRIKNKADFYKFIEDVVEGNDPYEAERRRVNDLVNHDQDGQNALHALERIGIVRHKA